jgi:polysaccharide export outer membrane protein
MNKIRVFASAAVLVLIGILTAPVPATAQSNASGYRVGPKDLIEVQVLEEPKFNGEIRVAEDGTIDLPYVGSLSVQGRTVNEVASDVRRLLERDLLQRATVTAQVKEFRSRPISVIGAVKEPGNLQFSGRWTLVEAITAAGGLSSEYGKTIYVMRRADSGLSAQLQIPVDELMLRANPSLNIPIYAGDLINVSPAVDVTVYCLGEVNRPGAVVFKDTERISLLTAIANVGGPTDRAGKRAFIQRQTAEGQTEIEVDLKRIIDGRSPDVLLQAGDVIVVKESFF